MGVTRRGFDVETKINNGGPDPLWSVSQYRRERGRVAGRDRLATRRPGWVLYHAALRAIGVGRGNDRLRSIVFAFERA